MNHYLSNKQRKETSGREATEFVTPPEHGEDANATPDGETVELPSAAKGAGTTPPVPALELSNDAEAPSTKPRT